MRDPSPALVTELAGRIPDMLDALQALVEAESPSSSPEACATCVELAYGLGEKLLGARAERHVVDGRAHLRWRFGRPRVLLVGHLDTVWPLGTVARWPFERVDELATGPGVLDMKAGVVQLLFALSVLDDLDGVAVLLTTDEEIGSPTSGALIDETAAGVAAALVLEPSAHGALKTERKGVSVFQLTVTGRAAHAGLAPASGANAAVELAHQLVAVAELGSDDAGTTVTPSLVSAGTAANTVPAEAIALVDVRTRTVVEVERVRSALGSLATVVSGTSLAVEETVTVPPLERVASAELYLRAQRLASALGLAPLTEAAVGGGSDGNRIARLGVPTLDGLGAVGDHAHAEGEFVSVRAMAERAALVTALAVEILGC